jgi:hypothetical protein
MSFRFSFRNGQGTRRRERGGGQFDPVHGGDPGHEGIAVVMDEDDLAGAEGGVPFHQGPSPSRRIDSLPRWGRGRYRRNGAPDHLKVAEQPPLQGEREVRLDGAQGQHGGPDFRAFEFLRRGIVSGRPGGFSGRRTFPGLNLFQDEIERPGASGQISLQAKQVMQSESQGLFSPRTSPANSRPPLPG